MNEIAIALISALAGGVIGPIFYNEYSVRKREKNWAKPRKALLLKMLQGREMRFRTIETLSRTSGCSLDDCRSLLIEIGARGAKLEGGKEGWALIDRAPLKEDLSSFEEDVAK